MCTTLSDGMAGAAHGVFLTTCSPPGLHLIFEICFGGAVCLSAPGSRGADSCQPSTQPRERLVDFAQHADAVHLFDEFSSVAAVTVDKVPDGGGSELRHVTAYTAAALLEGRAEPRMRGSPASLALSRERNNQTRRHN